MNTKEYQRIDTGTTPQKTFYRCVEVEIPGAQKCGAKQEHKTEGEYFEVDFRPQELVSTVAVMWPDSKRS
jgi:hypothetical protein